MPAFKPTTTVEALPVRGAAIERPVMDLKARDDSNPFERAKDVSAFANHLGGSLVIGASEVDGRLGAYVGLTDIDSARVRDHFSKAVEQRCQPLPRFECEDFPCPEKPAKRIVVINVWPSVLLHGVRIDGRTEDGYGGKCFVYPVRSGTDTPYLEPSQLAMYMTPHVRRIAVLLSAIPVGTLLEIHIVPSTSNAIAANWQGRIQEVREQENLLVLASADGGPMRRIPLDCVNTVFEDFDTNTNRISWRLWAQYHR